jgi:hypothetical protein
LATPPAPAVDPTPAKPPTAAGKFAVAPLKVESLPSNTGLEQQQNGQWR